ncbi:hypothetical protein MAM1_0300c09410 [Mucor ambiguus]|uniref:Protein arginine methyltransferase NDUFAF7 n=1 Tax=Mucor ambiguus TaxID=91626 RepID=A0A0C9N1M1_9FUNG|nr:hypothetical protein MAM1_0300c09410 [Mucor ambiguus]
MTYSKDAAPAALSYIKKRVKVVSLTKHYDGNIDINCIQYKRILQYTGTDIKHISHNTNVMSNVMPPELGHQATQKETNSPQFFFFSLLAITLPHIKHTMLRILRPTIISKRVHCIQFYSTTSGASTNAIKKEPLSPLGKHLHDSIKVTGPLTVSHFMRQVLVNPLSGYYMLGDVFGKQGDFVTSPEISQVFGELCGIWYLTEWMRLGQPSKTQIIEFGPGRGTLMSDMLRTLSQFPYFYKTLTDVHFIEASPGLRKMQRAALVAGSEEKDVVRVEGNKDEAPIETITREDGIKVSWHDGIEVVPDQWSFIMAHEFFDALPIHSFEKSGDEWRELMVDMDDTEERYNQEIMCQ